MQTLYGSHIKRRCWNYWKGTKRPTKFIIDYILKACRPTIYRKTKTTCASYVKIQTLNGDMIEVFKIVHDLYHLEAAVKLNFNTFSTTRGNNYKLQKSSCHYNIMKYSFCFTVVNTVNSLNWSRASNTSRGIRANCRSRKKPGLESSRALGWL